MSNRLTNARLLAKEAHGTQRYGDRPYVGHLDDVVQVLRKHGVQDTDTLCAGYLHDTVEDTDMTLEHIALVFGSRTQELVWAVTNPSGGNRKSHHAVTYPQIVKAGAVVLKLADRIANVTSCLVDNNTKLLKMYVGEYEDFKEALHRPGAVPDVHMWEELDELMIQAAEEMMGVSTDGILFYGFDLGEPGETKTSTDEADEWIRNHCSWAKHYAARKGVTQKEDESYGDFYDRRKVVLEESGCFIDHHCSGDYVMLYVAVKSFSASRGYAAPITAEDLTPLPDAEEKLRAFCEVMGIVFDPADIGWYLASYWG
jgi:hypothetical protein